MKVEIPEIRLHFNSSGKNDGILSIDILNNVVATSGTDKLIKLWGFSKSPTVNFEHSYTLSGHERGVNTIRFSPNGECLASCSDDAAIIVWHRANPANTARHGEFWGSITADNDLSKSILSCGHKGDVISLSWSPNSKFLCSSSVDNRVVIWNVKTKSTLKTISDHTQFVQGVAWDPLNMFIASQGNDKTCRIYGFKGGIYDSVVSTTSKRKPKAGMSCVQLLKDAEYVQIAPNVPGEPNTKTKYRMFLDDTFPSFFRRLSWSTDGSFLMVPSGVFKNSPLDNDVKNVVYGYARNHFSEPAFLLPCSQDSPALAIRFSPVLYKLRNPDDALTMPNIGIDSYRMMYVVVTLNSVMLYDTQQMTPIAVVHRLHYADLTDCSWSTDGTGIIVTSLDGYCSVLQLNEHEMGQLLPLQGICTFIYGLYYLSF